CRHHGKEVHSASDEVTAVVRHSTDSVWTLPSRPHGEGPRNCAGLLAIFGEPGRQFKYSTRGQRNERKRMRFKAWFSRLSGQGLTYAEQVLGYLVSSSPACG